MVASVISKCTCSSYEFMLHCWEENPEKRPNFSGLVSEITTALEAIAGYMQLSAIPVTKNTEDSTSAACNDTSEDKGDHPSTVETPL